MEPIRTSLVRKFWEIKVDTDSLHWEQKLQSGPQPDFVNHTRLAKIGCGWDEKLFPSIQADTRPVVGRIPEESISNSNNLGFENIQVTLYMVGLVILYRCYSIKILSCSHSTIDYKTTTKLDNNSDLTTKSAMTGMYNVSYE